MELAATSMTALGRLRATAAADRAAGHVQPRVRRLPLAVLLVAAIGFLALGLVEAWSDSPTFDEPGYAAAGLAAVLHHDLTFNDEHPPVPKVLAALPVLLAHPVIPSNGRWSGNDERAYSARFARAQLAAGRLRVVTFTSRLVPLAESAGVAFAVYGLSAELFGATAGAFAGLLWLASPLVLGIGHLDGTDIPFALAVTLCSWALARWLRLRSTQTLVWTGLAMGAAAGTQISGLIVVLATLAVIGCVTRRSGARRALASAGLAAGLSWICLWLPYVLLDPSVLAQPAILPRPYLDGIAYLASYRAGGAQSYLAGVAYTGSRWWFWPVSLVIKFPAAILMLLVAGALAWYWTGRTVGRRLLLAVGIPGLPLAMFTIASPLNIGVRLLLPVVALWAAAAGALVPAIAALRPAARRAAGTGAAALLAAGATVTALSCPGSIAWTAPLFRPGYAAAADSNLDWGQGLYALQSWSRGRHPWVSYFGPRGLTVAALPGARSLLGMPPDRISGWVAVSATALNSADRSRLAWLRSYCPVSVLAGSVLVFRFAQPPGAVPAPAPARPARVCAGTWSARPNQP
jgi:4-amino-4-deoxy-L-arabinose transferase-like glycosyltransferase